MDRALHASRRQVLRQAVEGLEARRLFATFIVTTINDDGAGSLRDAITQANLDATLDTIDFAITGVGVQRIQPATPLPKILTPVAIDGYSQPGSTANTLAIGDNAKPLIELNGDLMPNDDQAGLFFADTTFPDPDNLSGLDYVSAGGSSVRGLIVNGRFGGKIRVEPQSQLAGVTIAGNFIGTNAAGTERGPSTSPYALDGVVIAGYSAQGSRIGGPAPADRNVFGEGGSDIALLDHSSTTVVQNNYIGLDVTGAKSLFGTNGVEIDHSSSNVIGGTGAAERNVIYGNGAILIARDDSHFNRMIGNYIGTTADGATKPTGPYDMIVGVSVRFGASQNFVGGNTPAEGNVIAHAHAGVVVDLETSGSPIRHNSVFDCERPIYLGTGSSDPIDVNDNDDLDVGGNNGQNYAAITQAERTAGGTHLQAFLNSQSARGYVVDFFASPSSGNPQLGQARTFLGTVQVTTDTNGNATFSADLPAVPAGWVVTNTVTALATFPYGDTSPVSPSLAVNGVAPPPPADLPKLTVGDVSVAEGNSGTKTLTFTVKLSAAATSAVSVLYATQDGTAKTSDNDYVAKNGTLTFAAGETSKTVSVTIKGDTKSEIDESLKLLLGSATGATIAHGQAIGTIKNDDAAPAPPKLSVGGYTTTEGHTGTKAFTFKVTLDKSSGSPITVKYATQDDSAQSGSDYTAVTGTLTFAAGETSKTVTVYVKGDKTKEADEKFYLVLTSPTNAAIAVGRGTGLIKNDD